MVEDKRRVMLKGRAGDSPTNSACSVGVAIIYASPPQNFLWMPSVSWECPPPRPKKLKTLYALWCFLQLTGHTVSDIIFKYLILFICLSCLVVLIVFSLEFNDYTLMFKDVVRNNQLKICASGWSSESIQALHQFGRRSQTFAPPPHPRNCVVRGPIHMPLSALNVAAYVKDER